jgi:hypothetical protein
MFRSLSALRTINYGFNSSRLLTISSANTLKVKEEVKHQREAALIGGGKKRIDAQHKKGKKFLKFQKFEISVLFLLSRKINGT